MTEESGNKKGRTVGLGAFLAVLVAFIAVCALVGYIYINDTNNYRTLQQSYDQLAQDVVELEANYTTLYGLYSTLYANYSHLVDQYEECLTNYAALQISHNNLTQIVNLQKNQTIASSAVYHIPTNSFESVEISTSYAGYIQVQLSATKPVNLMLTNYKYAITMDYPVSGSVISSGSFIMPVLDGTNYLEIYAPSTSDTTVTLTITLVY